MMIQFDGLLHVIRPIVFDESRWENREKASPKVFSEVLSYHETKPEK